MSAARRSRNLKLMGNHQRSWIWGRHAVLEAIRSDRWSPQEILSSDDLEGEIRDELIHWSSGRQNSPEVCPVSIESSGRLTELCHHPDHQGLIARMPAYPYLNVADLLERITKETSLLILDGIQDAFNFGACLRCADVFGVDAVLVSTKGQSSVNAQVVRSSAGAIHHIPVAQTEDLTQTLVQLKSLGVNIVAATEKASELLPQANFTGALAVIVGNEGTGIDPARLSLCSQRVCIPQSGQVQSLNVAVATGIMLYELIRQRNFLEE